jgi:hypothetical protein
MSESVRTTPLPYRARPPQILLGVGAVLLVSAAVAVASVHGGLVVRGLLVALAGAAGWVSLRAGRNQLRSSEEVLAACAAALAVVGVSQGGPALDGDPVTALLLAAGFLVLHRLAPTTATWPLVSWAAFQLAVLRTIDLVPNDLHTELYLCAAVIGLGIALFGRRVVGRLALITTAPWWLAGVVGGSSSAWADDGGRQWLSAALMIAAAFGLLLARLRRPLDPLLGPPAVVPVVAGVISGAAVTGAFSSLGPLSMTFTGYAGVLLANLAAAYLTGWRRGLFLPVARAAGIVMAALCLVQLLAGERWAQLSLLLLLTAIPTALVAVRRAEERPVALPTAIGCLAGALLFALPDGVIGPVPAALLLTALYGVAMAVGSALDAPGRKATARVAAVCAVVAALLLRAQHEQTALAAALAVQGGFTLAWAWRTRPARDDGPATTAWRVGAGQLVLAIWMAAAEAGLAHIEWYTLPTAVGLLIAAGPRLTDRPSGKAWGPGLLVAVVPTAVLAVVQPHVGRAVAVMVVAALVMIAASRTGVRAPLLIGAGTELWMALGFAWRALPWPLAAAMAVGSVVLAQGMRRERRPVPVYDTPVAQLR